MQFQTKCADECFCVHAVRAKLSPQRYFPSLPGKSDHSSLVIDRHIRELMMQGYNKLANAYPPLCISKDEDGMTFESTELGRVMAKYCVAFKVLFCWDGVRGARVHSTLLPLTVHEAF